MFYSSMFLAILFFCTSIFSADNGQGTVAKSKKTLLMDKSERWRITKYKGLPSVHRTINRQLSIEKEQNNNVIPSLIMISPPVVTIPSVQSSSRKREKLKNKKCLLSDKKTIKKPTTFHHKTHELTFENGLTQRVKDGRKLLITIELALMREKVGLNNNIYSFADDHKLEELKYLILTLHKIKKSSLIEKIDTIEVKKISSFSSQELQDYLNTLETQDNQIKNLIKHECRIIVLQDGSIVIRRYGEDKRNWQNMKHYPRVITIKEQFLFPDEDDLFLYDGDDDEEDMEYEDFD